MHIVNDTIEAFGRQIGIDGMALNEKGVCFLRFEKGDEVSIENQGEKVLICYARRYPYLNADLMEKFLKSVYYRSSPLPDMGVCLKGDDKIILFARIAVRTFSLSTLVEVMEKLRLLHENYS